MNINNERGAPAKLIIIAVLAVFAAILLTTLLSFVGVIK